MSWAAAITTSARPRWRGTCAPSAGGPPGRVEDSEFMGSLPWIDDSENGTVLAHIPHGEIPKPRPIPCYTPAGPMS